MWVLFFVIVFDGDSNIFSQDAIPVFDTEIACIEAGIKEYSDMQERLTEKGLIDRANAVIKCKPAELEEAELIG